MKTITSSAGSPTSIQVASCNSDWKN